MAAFKNKDTKVSVPGFTVDDNVIYYGNTAINTNNVSMISISPIPSNKSWIYALFIALGGIFVGEARWLAFLVAAVWIIAVVIYNKGRGEDLAISLNSGNTIYFHCREREFLERVVTLITGCIKTGAGHYSVSFDKCVINKGTVNDGVRIR
ncbi:MAG: hypothetical protein NC120_11260 [Ruminococcus sp.]|nr:hypothetical protein [Ruminococcus sp.]